MQQQKKINSYSHYLWCFISMSHSSSIWAPWKQNCELRNFFVQRLYLLFAGTKYLKGKASEVLVMGYQWQSPYKYRHKFRPAGFTNFSVYCCQSCASVSREKAEVLKTKLLLFLQIICPFLLFFITTEQFQSLLLYGTRICSPDRKDIMF